jgi:hypothetical protein
LAVKYSRGDLVRILQGWAVLIVISFLSPFVSAQSQPQLNLMPLPATVQSGAGQLLIDQSFSVAVTGFHDASLDSGVRRFQAQLSKQTGIPFRPKAGATNASLQINVDHGREQVQKMNPTS